MQLSKEEIEKLFPDDNFGKDFEEHPPNNNVNPIPLLPPVPEHLNPNYRFTHLEPTEVYLARLGTFQ